MGFIFNEMAQHSKHRPNRPPNGETHDSTKHDSPNYQ